MNAQKVLSPLENKNLNYVTITFCTHTPCMPPDVRYFKPLTVEGMKTCQIQVVWDLVETVKRVFSSRGNACFSTPALKSGVKKMKTYMEPIPIGRST